MFPIISVAPDSVISDEQLGSKTKFWFALGEDRWLFKESRPQTGEDWAEKIASALAADIGISAAHVELAEYEGRLGSASKSFVRADGEALVHGNELLAGKIVGYDRTKKLRQSDHTLGNIINAVRALFGESDPLHMELLSSLASYLVLDALIGNTDRHHENWGLLVRYEAKEPRSDSVFQLRVAPSFDHASSLGRELLDARRAELMRTGAIERYARSGHGGIYLRSSDRRGANPLDLVEFGARHFPDYFRNSLHAVARTPLKQLLGVIELVPESRMSDAARQFAAALLTYTQRALMSLVP